MEAGFSQIQSHIKLIVTQNDIHTNIISQWCYAYPHSMQACIEVFSNFPISNASLFGKFFDH